jgi:hypothetical protein
MSRPYPMLIPSLAATLGLLARALSAQPPAQSNEKAVLHTHSAPLSDQVIDGATHPELIPDSTAYRLVFVVIGEPPNPAPQRTALQTARLNAAGLTGNDAQAAIGILATFKTKYADLVTSYNQAVVGAQQAGAAPDLPAFLASRGALVQSARDALTSVLTPQGAASLDSYVQHEKQRMKTSKEIQ